VPGFYFAGFWRARQGVSSRACALRPGTAQDKPALFYLWRVIVYDVNNQKRSGFLIVQ
jgi:hypothetical protein